MDRDGFAMAGDDTLDRLLRARGLDRYAHFWTTGEGREMPNGEEEESRYVLAPDWRVYFWWTGWDSEQQAPILKYWDEATPDPSWADSAEYVRPRECIGLGEASGVS
jgi:hypothetical protein